MMYLETEVLVILYWSQLSKNKKQKQNKKTKQVTSKISNTHL